MCNSHQCAMSWFFLHFPYPSIHQSSLYWSIISWVWVVRICIFFKMVEQGVMHVFIHYSKGFRLEKNCTNIKLVFVNETMVTSYVKLINSSYHMSLYIRKLNWRNSFLLEACDGKLQYLKTCYFPSVTSTFWQKKPLSNEHWWCVSS